MMQKTAVLMVLLLLIFPVRIFAQSEGQEIVANVRGEAITVSDFQMRVRMERFLLINNINNVVQFYRNQGYCGGKISIGLDDQSPYSSWIVELQNPDQLGLRILNETIDEWILRQEAKTLNIDVGPEELQAQLDSFLGLSSAQDNATLTPDQAEYNQQIVNHFFNDLQQAAGLTETEFRDYLKNIALRQKLQAVIAKDQQQTYQDTFLNDWLDNLEAKAGNKIQIFELWRDNVPMDPTFTWPPAEPVELIPTPNPAGVLSYTFSITFDEIYQHPSGLFSVGIPLGWKADAPVSQSNNAEITFLNETEESVVQITVQQADGEITDFEALNGLYTPEILAASWANYTCYQEVSRSQDDNKLVIDFRLHTQESVFIGRQVSWADRTWLYNIRVIEPEQRSDLLEYLLDNLVATFKFNSID